MEDANRLSFHNICKKLLKKKGEGTEFNSIEQTRKFFADYFCCQKLIKLPGGEIQEMLMSRTIKYDSTLKRNRAKQHAWLKNVFGPFLENKFDVTECCNQIINYTNEKDIVDIKELRDELKEFLVDENFNFTPSTKNPNKSEIIIDLISKAIEQNELYIALVFLMLTSLYPCHYTDKNNVEKQLNPAEDHSNILIKYIKNYKKRKDSESVYNDIDQNGNTTDTEKMSEYLTETAKYQYNLAKGNIGRLVPPAIAQNYPTLKTPDLHSTYSNQAECLSLEKIIKKHPENHIMAIGSGGCGKTYTLIELAGKLLEDSSRDVLPIYVPLNDFNSKTDSVFEYICTLIYKKYEYDSSLARKQLDKWLKSEHCGRILLLLDGFNEIASADLQVSIAGEVKRLQAEYCNLRFVITSRYDMSDAFAYGTGSIDSKFLSYYVDELSDETVKKYIIDSLKNRTDVSNIIEKAKDPDKKDSIKSFLKNPMALVMYCFMHRDEIPDMKLPHKDCHTLGELIDNYVRLIKKSSVSTDTRKANDEAEPFLQYVGFSMNNDGLFKISTARLNQYAKEFGLKYGVKDWLDVGFIRDMTKYAVHGDTVTHIEFIHQNYRDFFAAGYLKSVLLFSEYESKIKCFGDKIIPMEVLELLGNILEEYKYKDKTENGDTSAIQGVLSDIGDNLTPPAIAQIIHTAAIARDNDLSSFSFRGLDLSATALNQIKLYKGKETRAVFDGANITKFTLNALGHPGSVASMLFVKNRYLVTFSKLGIFCFDMELRKHYRIADYKDCAIRAALHLEDQALILTGDSWGNVVLWEYCANNVFELKEIDSKSIYGKTGATSGLLYEIQDLINFKGRIYASAARGEVHRVTVKNSCIEDVISIISFTPPENKEKPNCRLSASENAMYCSSGNFVVKYQMEPNGELKKKSDTIFDGTEIFDIAVVEGEEQEDVLINLRSVDENGSTVSKVMRYSFDDRSESKITSKIHSTQRVGFRGWNSFTEPYHNFIYLTANIEDAADKEAGLLKISLSDNNEEKYSHAPLHGNRHSMSVNCAIAFDYNGTEEYIATGSTERSVEIMRVKNGSGTLLYHLDGHDNGVHYIDIVDNTKIYAAHYSGEVSEWLCINDRWRCSHVYAPHSNWVWECRHVSFGENSYVISCSYDNNIAVVNTLTEETVCLITEPTSRVLSFGFLSTNIILTGYTKGGKSILQKFEIDYINKRYTAGKEITVLSDIPSELRSIHTASDRLFLCANRDGKGYIFPAPNEGNLSLDGFKYVSPHEISEDGSRINLRCADEIKYDDRTIVACGGDYRKIGDYALSYIRVFIDNVKNAESSLHSPNSGGCSALKLIKYKEEVYLVSGDYDGNIFLYSIDASDGKIVPIDSSCRINDKILNIQAFNEKIYFSTLGGNVYEAPFSEMISGSYPSNFEAKKIFSCISGLRCCNIDFTRAHTNWDPQFKKLIGYYGKVGR